METYRTGLYGGPIEIVPIVRKCTVFSILPKATPTDKRNRIFWAAMTVAAICFFILIALHLVTGCAVLNQTYTAADGMTYKSRGMAFGEAQVAALKTSFSDDRVDNEKMIAVNQSADSMKAEGTKLVEAIGPLVMQFIQWAAANAAKGAAIP